MPRSDSHASTSVRRSRPLPDRAPARWPAKADAHEPFPALISRARADRESSPVTTRDHRHASAIVSRAHVLCEAGEFAEAELAARQALVRWPGLPTARVALGRALVGANRLDEAQAVLFATIHAHPGYAAAQRWLAEALLRAGDEQRGRAFLADALRSPADPDRLDDLIVRETGEIVLPPPIPGSLEPSFDPTPRPRRRWPWRAIALIAAVMFVALVTGGLLAAVVDAQMERSATADQ